MHSLFSSLFIAKRCSNTANSQIDFPISIPLTTPTSRLPCVSTTSVYDVCSDYRDAQNTQQDTTWLLSMQAETNQGRCILLVVGVVQSWMSEYDINRIGTPSKRTIEAITWPHKDLSIPMAIQLPPEYIRKSQVVARFLSVAGLQVRGFEADAPHTVRVIVGAALELTSNLHLESYHH
jgi:hypothetical protein